MEATKEKVKERPILFSTPMVIALLTDQKDITRRMQGLEAINGITREVKHSGYYVNKKGQLVAQFKDGDQIIECPCPYGVEGDNLWVRETLYQNGELGIEYFANKETIDEMIIPNDYGPYGGDYSFRAIPNIHMPRWACRLILGIKSLRVERLHDITEEDAIREGVEKVADYGSTGYKLYTDPEKAYSDIDALWSFRSLWESINGKESWDANPWVWRIEFKKL